MRIDPPVADEILLTVIRHGETESNAVQRYIGQGDSPLSPRGLEQVEALARRFADEAIDALYSSDLGRAERTAAAIARSTGLAPMLDERLRERQYGELEGLGYRESIDRFPETFAAFDRFDIDTPIPGGESARQVRDRVASFVDEHVLPHGGRSIVAVCHGGIMRTFLWHLLDLPYRAARYARSDNTSVSAFRLRRGRWNLQLWNDTSHGSTDRG